LKVILRERKSTNRKMTLHTTADFKHAAELTPRGAFDVLAQAEATRRVRQLSKRLPCETPIEPGTTARACDRRQPAYHLRERWVWVIILLQRSNLAEN
jgi:hypothetical protein